MSELNKTIDELGDAFGDFKSSYGQKMDSVIDRLERVEVRQDKPGFGGLDHGQKGDVEVFRKWLSKGLPEDEQQMTSLARKDVQTGVGADGGAAVPKVINNIVEQQVVQISPIRALARIDRISTPDYTVLVDVRGTASGWVGETDARANTATPTLEEVTPSIGELYANPRATQWSIDDIQFNVEQWLANSVSTEFAAQEGTAFVSGDGVNKPTGFLNGTPVLTADDSRAFGTLQYVASGQASTITPDSIYNLIYAVKTEYRAGGAAFVMNADTLNVVRQFKDQQDQYLWQPSVIAGQPSMLAGYPVVECHDMPSVGADTFPIAFGNWKRGYLIVDRTDMRMLRDPYTAKPYVQFYTTKRVGGSILDSNAIKLLRCEV